MNSSDRNNFVYDPKYFDVIKDIFFKILFFKDVFIWEKERERKKRERE